jgi:hypothetical protein
MATKLQRRRNLPAWRIIERLGWSALLLALPLGGFSLWFFLNRPERPAMPFLITGSLLVLGAILIAGARKSDIAYHCSECGEPVGPENKTCNRCFLVFDP